jgi:hypothetical protein
MIRYFYKFMNTKPKKTSNSDKIRVILVLVGLLLILIGWSIILIK